MNTLAKTLAARWRAPEAGEESEAGFTLIELLIVLLIMAILMAIAIPTFLGIRATAQNRAAETNLRDVLADVQAQYVNADSFSGVTMAKMQAYEPVYTWVTTGATNAVPNEVSLVIPNLSGNAQSAIMADQSATGECYGIAQINSALSQLDLNNGASPGTWYGKWPPVNGSPCSPQSVYAVGNAPAIAVTWNRDPSIGWG